MSKTGTIVISLLVVAALALIIFVVAPMMIRNDIIQKRNAVDKSWADVQSVYQRRLDVLPKFAENAKFSARFQESLQVRVARAREQMKGVLNEANPEKFAAGAGQLFSPIVAYMRNEATTTANTAQITELNAQIETIERTINHQRDAYNDAVLTYNNTIQTWPGSAVAGTSFTKRESFAAQAGAENSPDLHMNN